MLREGSLHRTSVSTASRLRNQSYQSAGGRNLWEQAYDSLADVTKTIDIVEIFRPSEEVPEIVEQALARDDVKTIWMQLGIRNDEAARAAEAAGVNVVQDHCMEVEHGQLIRHPMD